MRHTLHMLLRPVMAAVAAAITGTVFTLAAAAAGAGISAPQGVAEGESFTVTVSFSADENIGSVKARIIYDSDVIEFISGDFANGAGGLCMINGWAETQGRTQSYELTFKAVAVGTSELVMENTSVYSESGDLLGSPVSIASVTVGRQKVTTTTTTTAAVVTTEPPQTETSAGETSEVVTTTAAAVEQVTEVMTEEEIYTSPEVIGDGNQQVNDNAGENDEASAVTEGVGDGQPAEGSTESGGDTEEDDTNGTVTAILITVGLVVIVCLSMTGGSGSGKKRSGSRKRRR